MAKKKSYRFTGKEGTSLPGTHVKKMIQRHLDHHEVRAHFFGKEILTKILNQSGCMGIRFHHAINDKGEKTLVMVGADAKGVNMWSTNSKAKLKGVGSTAADFAYPCPPYC
jgi:hypothetical protein